MMSEDKKTLRNALTAILRDDGNNDLRGATLIRCINSLNKYQGKTAC